MNGGKSHAYFTWAASHAWVPPVYFDTLTPVPHNLTYANITAPAPELADHDPLYAALDQQHGRDQAQPWVRPDFVVKADDDSFVMLAELEARLRAELHARPPPASDRPIEFPIGATFLAPSSSSSSGATHQPSSVEKGVTDLVPTDSDASVDVPSGTRSQADRSDQSVTSSFSGSLDNSTWPLNYTNSSSSNDSNMDPLIYWGYLVKNRFMAGELYALSYSLTTWIANDTQVRTMIRGAEDKQTAKWMRMHPRADEVRWASERCWIYDHPRAGTV